MIFCVCQLEEKAIEEKCMWQYALRVERCSAIVPVPKNSCAQGLAEDLRACNHTPLLPNTLTQCEDTV